MNIEQKLILYYDDQLDQEECIEVEQILAQDESLQRQLDELKVLRAAFQDFAEQELRAYEHITLADQVMANLPDHPDMIGRQTRAITPPIREEKKESWYSWFGLHWQGIMLGACAAAALLLTWQWSNMSQNSVTSQKNSTVLIKNENSAPVIWVLDEEDLEDDTETLESDQADETPPI